MATLLRSPFFGRGTGPCGWGRVAEPFQRCRVTVPSRAGPGRAGPGGGGRAGAGGALRGCGGAEPLGSRAATALLPRSRPLRPLHRPPTFPSRLREAPRTREKRESKGWGRGFQSKNADECSEVSNRLRPPLLWGLFQEEVPADISGFARNAVSLQKNTQGTGFWGKSCRGRGSGAAVPQSPGGPARRTRMDAQMDRGVDKRGQRAGETCLSFAFTEKLGLCCLHRLNLYFLYLTQA